MPLEDALRKQVRFLFLALTMIRPVIIVIPSIYQKGINSL